MDDGSESTTWQRIDRRTYLATAAAAAGVGLAGCSGDGGDGGGNGDGGSDGGDGGASSDGGDDTPEPTDSPTETDSPTPESGVAEEWETSLGEFRLTGNTFTGAFSSGRLFVATPDAGVSVLDSRNGDRLWEHTDESGYGDLAATPQQVFVTFEGGMAALAADTGEESWRVDAEGGDLVATTGDLVVRDGGGFDPSPVYDAASGEELRTLEGAGGYHMLADRERGHVYSGAGANTRSHELGSGEQRWRVRRPLSRRPALVGGDLVKTVDGNFVVYDGATGRAIEQSAGNVGGPTVGGNGIAIGVDSEGGTVYGFAPAASSMAWSTEVAELGFVAPAVVNGQVVLEGGDGLVALALAGGERTGDLAIETFGTAGLVGGDSRVFRAYRSGGEALVTGFSTPSVE